MRFEKVTARAFGPLVNQTLELAPGMNVVHGPNEAGKSTWHAALYAGLCGRKRGQGRPSPQDQAFRERHKPWDGTKWEARVVVRLEDGQRIEVRHDLEGNVNCRATDADLGTDVSAAKNLIHDGSPDGSKLIGLDRRAFLATACVRQADLLGIREEPKLLQEYLQHATSSAGTDSTAVAALARIDAYQQEQVGLDRANAVKPLRRAVVAEHEARGALEQACQAHERHLQLAEQVERQHALARAAAAQVQAMRARLAEVDAATWRARADRASALAAQFPDGAPAGAAGGESLAQDVATAITRWQEAPSAPELSGASSEELQRQLRELPVVPEGDQEPHSSVLSAAGTFRTAEAAADGHASTRPAGVAEPAAGGLGEQELRDLARDLATPIPDVDPALEQRYETAGARAKALEGRAPGRNSGLLAAGGALVLLGAVLSLVGLVVLGVPLLLVGLGLLVWASRQGGGVAEAQAAAEKERWAASDALGSQRHARELARERVESAQARARAAGVPSLPSELMSLAEAVSTWSTYRRDLARWESRAAELGRAREAAALDLERALVARGAVVAEDLALALAQYEAGCRERARLAVRAGRRGDLEQRLRDRLAREQQARDAASKQAEAAASLREVASRCGVAGTSEAELVAALEAWRAGHLAASEAREQASRGWVEMQGLLEGRTLAELRAEAARKEELARRLGADLDAALLTSVQIESDPVAQLERLEQAERQARAAHEHLRGELKASSASTLSVPEAEEALAAARRELERVRELDRILELTRSFLAKAQERVHRDIAPVLSAAVRKRLPLVTNGRYTDVRVDPQTLEVQVCTAGGEWRKAALLSHGTAEQIYLLLRVAMAEHLTKPGEVCPLVLDDVTVQADAERTVAVLDALHEISRERQVILFSQEEEVLAWAEQRLTGQADRLVRLGERVPVAA